MITHPFHPHRGRGLRLHDGVGGCERSIVRYFADGTAGAILFSVPVSWTSLRRVDDFERASSGRSLLRADDLVALREVVDALLPAPAKRDQK